MLTRHRIAVKVGILAILSLALVFSPLLAANTLAGPDLQSGSYPVFLPGVLYKSAGGTSPTPTPSAPRPPAAPSNLKASPPASTTRSLQLTWNDNASGETGYELERKDGGAFTLIANLGPDATSYLDSGLTPATRYEYRLRSLGKDGVSVWVGVSANTPNPPQTIPASPASCWVENITSTSVDFHWSDSSMNEEFFNIYIFQPPGDFRPIGQVAENSTWVTIVDLPPDSGFQLRVSAENSAGISQGCAMGWIRTLAESSASQVRFTNDASYPVVSLIIDDVEYFDTYPQGLLPGSYYEIALPPGTHSYELTTGFWEDRNNRFLMYTYWDDFEVTGGQTTEFQVTDISIENLMTQFSSSGYWEGDFWTANGICYTSAFRFYPDGTYKYYVRNQEKSSGSYWETGRLPSIFSTSFKVFESPDQEGLLVEPYGYFTMKNGPDSWKQITYSYKPQGYQYNPFCP